MQKFGGVPHHLVLTVSTGTFHLAECQEPSLVASWTLFENFGECIILDPHSSVDSSWNERPLAMHYNWYAIGPKSIMPGSFVVALGHICDFLFRVAPSYADQFQDSVLH
jgi:hypothetical protein